MARITKKIKLCCHIVIVFVIKVARRTGKWKTTNKKVKKENDQNR